MSPRFIQSFSVDLLRSYTIDDNQGWPQLALASLTFGFSYFQF